jgi:hypothetical protein
MTGSPGRPGSTAAAGATSTAATPAAADTQGGGGSSGSASSAARHRPSHPRAHHTQTLPGHVNAAAASAAAAALLAGTGCGVRLVGIASTATGRRQAPRHCGRHAAAAASGPARCMHQHASSSRTRTHLAPQERIVRPFAASGPWQPERRKWPALAHAAFVVATALPPPAAASGTDATL